MVYDASPLPRGTLLDTVVRLARRALPLRCLACGEPGDDGLDLCAACHAALPLNRNACLRCALPLAAPGTCGRCLSRPPPLHAVHAAFAYAAPLDRLLPRYKFHQDLAAGHLLAQLMAHALAGCERPQGLVPVPLHRARLRQRGYDQALELARPLASTLRLPLHVDLLQRVRATPAQSQLDATARRRNLRGAFGVTGRPLPAHVALVDDVMTTGATLHAAAAALRRAGVARVDAWVCARTP
ncbi:MAG: ComF family protein [Pseudoxanthomonas sp.]|nr:ComF family protein [Pseudoxanthomonas sp.]